METKRVFDSSSHTLLPKLPPRSAESHKGDFGRLLCVCGSVGMAGAAYLCAKSAYRTGAGIVEIYTPEENRTVLQTLIPEAIVTVYSSASPDLAQFRASVERADAVVVGCGLSTRLASARLLDDLLRLQKRPMVIDADALNIISSEKSLLGYLQNTVITPHIGEMSRLIGCEASDIASDREETADRFAEEHSLICVLKSHNTVVSDGKQNRYVNRIGNSGMATGGSGDVLAGVIGGILAQNKKGTLSEFDAAVLGVYLHSSAGDIAGARLGEYSLMAGDIVDSLPEAILSYKKISVNY